VDGSSEGVSEGTVVGTSVGDTEGSSVGETEGEPVGSSVGKQDSTQYSGHARVADTISLFSPLVPSSSHRLSLSLSPTQSQVRILTFSPDLLMSSNDQSISFSQNVSTLGTSEGDSEGNVVGADDGEMLGNPLGMLLGTPDGLKEGLVDGRSVGTELVVGVTLG